MVLTNRIDEIAPTTINPDLLRRQSLGYLYRAEDVDNKPLSEPFAEVLRPPVEDLPQANIRAWIFVLSELKPVDRVDPGREVEMTGKALCDLTSVLPNPHQPWIPAWTRAVAILTMTTVERRLSRPPDERFLTRYGLREGLSLRLSLEQAVEELYREAADPNWATGPQAFYWLARALEVLDPADDKAPVHGRPPWQSAGTAPAASDEPRLRRYFRRLTAGRPDFGSDADEADDTVLAYLARKQTEPPLPETAYLRGNLRLTVWEWVCVTLGGRIDRMSRTGWSGLVLLVLSATLAGWGLVVGIPAYWRVAEFREPENRMNAELQGRAYDVKRP